MSFRLRPATPADVALLRGLEDAIFPEDPWTDGMISEELAALAARGDDGSVVGWGRVYVVAEKVEEGVPVQAVGYAGISLGLDADVMTIGVLPNWRGCGVGSRLVGALVDAARMAGSERIFLEVRESNVPAQSLYAAHGFQRVGRVKGYFRHPVEDAVTMCVSVLSESSLS